MNVELRRTVQKLLASETDPAVAAQALNDYWWFRHGQPHELTEILETTIQYYLLRDVDLMLDKVLHKPLNREPLLDEEWAAER